MLINIILQGHVLYKIKDIPDNSIDCIVTSPPYWGLRDYKTESVIWGNDINCKHEWGDGLKMLTKIGRDGNTNEINKKQANHHSGSTSGNFCNNCNAWKGSLGLEPTFQMYINHLLQIFEALKSKLSDHGSLWVNLGDTYAGGGNANGHTGVSTNTGRPTLAMGATTSPPQQKIKDVSRKSLIGIPDRFKIAMIDEGWVCRNEIIWHKESVMPSSAKDRFTVDFEKFYFFTKKPKYYFEQQLDPYTTPINRYGGDTWDGSEKYNNDEGKLDKNLNHTLLSGESSLRPNPLGRNMRTTWTINPKGFKEAHFAVFPEELIEVPIKAGCPKKVCMECGKPQTKVISCDCNVEFRKGIVLDPFMGSGTTAVVAANLNRNWLGIELSEEYIEIAKKRIYDNTSEHLDEWFDEE